MFRRRKCEVLGNYLGERIFSIVKISLPQAMSVIEGKPGGEIDNFIVLKNTVKIVLWQMRRGLLFTNTKI